MPMAGVLAGDWKTPFLVLNLKIFVCFFLLPRRAHRNGALRNIGLKIRSVAFNDAPHAPRYVHP
jgi:hypothetical protein